MADLISREDVCRWYCQTTCDKDYCTEPCREIKELWEIQPKTGEWIYGCSDDMGYSEDYDMTCKACGKSMLKNDFIYCPYCGSLNYAPHTEDIPMEYFENGGI